MPESIAAAEFIPEPNPVSTRVKRLRRFGPTTLFLLEAYRNRTQRDLIAGQQRTPLSWCWLAILGTERNGEQPAIW